MSPAGRSGALPTSIPTWVGDRRSRTVTVFRRTVAPLALIISTPPAVIALWIDITYLGGSLRRLATAEGVAAVRQHFPRPTAFAVAAVTIFVLFEAALLVLLPARQHEGPLTPSGVRPRYRLNGLPAWLVTHATFFAAAGLGWFPPSVLYDHFGDLVVTLCLFALAFCVLLYVKGRFAPSTPDAGSSGNPIMDFFWGLELHPTVLGLNLKQLVNCRVGMMGWSLTVLSFAARQYEDLGRVSASMAVCVTLQIVYILKFFHWERGYFASLDITHDRFGYYLCWGVTVWVPAFYTTAAQYLVKHPVGLRPAVAAALLVLGLAAIAVNYETDAQRQRVRETGGAALVWRRPARLIRAEYRTGDGVAHQSLLLVSGWWGLARHFHYVPEFIVALSWSLAAGFGSIVPYLYPIFLAVLLVDRAGRDDLRCATKYGRFWEEYRNAVRWRIVPFVY